MFPITPIVAVVIIASNIAIVYITKKTNDKFIDIELEDLEDKKKMRRTKYNSNTKRRNIK